MGEFRVARLPPGSGRAWDAGIRLRTRARKELWIPDEFQVEAMAAIGRPGPKESLTEKLQARETPNDRRRVSESIFEGPFK